MEASILRSPPQESSGQVRGYLVTAQITLKRASRALTVESPTRAGRIDDCIRRIEEIETWLGKD